MRKNILEKNDIIKRNLDKNLNKKLDKKLNEKVKEEKAITLIALVITVIVLLILAGVTIATLTGENGLITKAQQAALESKYAGAAEKVALAVSASYDTTGKLKDSYLKDNLNRINGIKEQVETVKYDLKVVVDGFEFTISEFGIITGKKDFVIADEELPENTPQNPQDAGKEVALKDGWGMQHVTYVKTIDGTEVKTLETVATVYAVSVGSGETVPIPGDGKTEGFYYVGGTLNTGVIISDNVADKYDGKVDKTTHEYAPQLKGNQFVWIPCTTNSSDTSKTLYTKTSWGKENAEWDTTTPKAEVQQIEKYGGFYVGRYEAGLASSISEFTTDQKHDGSNQIYNKDGVPQSKAGVVPWMFIDWTHSKANAESMYNNNYVSSGLITGTQWDVILNTMKSKAGLSDSDITNSNSWGNYKNKQLTFTGRKTVASHNGSNWILAPFGTQTTDGTKGTYSGNGGELLTTGASTTTQKYHIYDIAGNLWEWIEEDSHYATRGQYRVIRGGCYVFASSVYPACYRVGGSTVSWTSYAFGFRAVLYIK